MGSVEMSFKGPKDTPYEGGKFTVDMKLGDQYPALPPKVQFQTRIWHPNVSSATGAICHDMLTTDKWLASYNMRSIGHSLYMMLLEPNDDSPLDAQVANQRTHNREEYLETAKFYTQEYAASNTTRNERYMKAVQELVTNYSFTRDNAIRVLSHRHWKISDCLKNPMV